MKALLLVSLAVLSAAALARADEPIRGVTGPKLMDKYHCESCHSLQDNPSMKGPSLRAIAHKYASDPEGRDDVESAILGGSSGDWGSDTMPAFAIPESELTPLITWILAQWP
jgi:cytochrome c551/c552